MKHLLVVIAGVVLCQTTFYNRLGNGGLMVTQPGSHYSPPTFVMPLQGGGYMISRPGARPYQPPTYIRELPNGGIVTNQPGVAVVVPQGNDNENEDDN